MPVYHYTVVDELGNRFKSRATASSVSVLRKHLFEDELYLVGCVRKVIPEWLDSYNIHNLELVDNFSQSLALLLKTKMTLVQALEIMADGCDQGVAMLACCLQRDIGRGCSLSEAVTRHPHLFGLVYRSMLVLAEETGNQITALESISASVRWQLELRKQIRRVLIYPAIVSLVMLLVLIFLVIFVVPGVQSFVESMGQTLPFYSIVLFEVSGFFLKFGYLIVLLSVLAMLLCAIAYKANREIRRRAAQLLLRVTLIGPLIVRIKIAYFAHCMSVLCVANHELPAALELSRSGINSDLFSIAIDRIKKRLESGENLSDCVARERLFPPDVSKIVGIGEQSGDLATIFLHLRFIYERQIQETVDRIEQLAGPLLILLLGGLMLWMILSVVSPLYDVMAFTGLV